MTPVKCCAIGLGLLAIISGAVFYKHEAPSAKQPQQAAKAGNAEVNNFPERADSGPVAQMQSSEASIETALPGSTVAGQNCYRLRDKASPSSELCLNWARENIWSQRPSDRIRAMTALINLNPSEAVDAARTLISLHDKPYNIALVGYAVLHLQDSDAALQNDDLYSFYQNGDTALQMMTATMLANRGDDTLLRDYVDARASDLRSKDAQLRARAVESIGYFQKNEYAARQILPLLNDEATEVRLQAVQALAYCGDKTHIKAVEQLLRQESDENIRQSARSAIEALREDGASGRMRIRPMPGMIADGLPDEP